MFVLTPEGTLVAMKPKEFELEVHFQKLLEQYPDLLSGELIDPESPRKWLLIAPEVPMVNGENVTDLWVDHLFLDQDGVLTIVEVKRQSDARLRREVIAQILDYAANGLVRWKVGDLRGLFEGRCGKLQQPPEEVFQKAFNGDVEYASFWESVKTNLDARKVRMLLVADVIPREVKVVIEFLNSQMNPAEMLALELRQYTGDNGLRTIVPTLFGQTEMSRGAKSAGESRTWDEATIMGLLETKHGAAVAAVARRIVDWMQKYGPVRLGKGKADGSFNATFISEGQKVHPLTIFTMGRLYINAGYCVAGTFADANKRLEWLTKINEIEGVHIPLNVDKFPTISLATLAVGNRVDKFLEVMDWFVSQL